ncbi:MAG: Gfo/Idh/MocA family oxidoreductase [Armatimonadetes bacterium]|nr:Gfo/Idh/MocA family oxidoreductase [Armatimonadota bacterium]
MALRVAVIGVRAIGNTHAEVYQTDDLAELVAVCDIVPERADSAAARWDCRAYYSVEDLLRNEDLDAVSVTTGGFENGSWHYEPVMECLAARKHVLCEKPISNNIQHAREMVRAAREAGVYFGINLNHRFVPPAAKAKQWVQEGRLGHLLLTNMTMWIDNPNETSPWFHLRALHPHSLDIMRYYCGDVKRVQAFANRAPKPDGGQRVCFSNAQVNLEFANGVVGHLTGSYDAAPRHNLERCEVMGTEGRFILDNCYEELTFYPRRGEELTVIRNSIMGGLSGFGATFRTRIHRWLEQVTAGVPREQIEASGEDGLAVQEAIEAAIRSIEGGTVEEVPAAV